MVENDMKFKYQCPYKKLHQNTARLIGLHIVHGCFLAAKPVATKIEWPTKSKIFIIWLFIKKLPNFQTRMIQSFTEDMELQR